MIPNSGCVISQILLTVAAISVDTHKEVEHLFSMTGGGGREVSEREIELCVFEAERGREEREREDTII